MRFAWLRLALATSLLFVGGCATTRQVTQRHPLYKQIITPLPGYDGKLTNSACLKYKKADQCEKWETVAYDLKSKAFRDLANSFDFICNVAGRRYVICDDKPGFCRRDFERKCTLGIFCGPRRLVREDYLPATPYQPLLDADLRCFNKNLYPFNGIN